MKGEDGHQMRQAAKKKSGKNWPATPHLFDSEGSSESCKKFMLVATVRSIKIGKISASTSLQTIESRMELDTHADTTVLGKSCLIIQDYNKAVSVLGWNASVGSTKCQFLEWLRTTIPIREYHTCLYGIRPFIWTHWIITLSVQCSVEWLGWQFTLRCRFVSITPPTDHMLLWSRTQ